MPGPVYCTTKTARAFASKPNAMWFAETTAGASRSDKRRIGAPEARHCPVHIRIASTQIPIVEDERVSRARADRQRESL